MDEHVREAARQIQREYARGKEYKTGIGLYETCKKNENFYLGKQWEGLKSSFVRPMTFNMIRRIIATAQALVVSDDIGFDCRPFLSTEERDEQGLIIEEAARVVIERQKIKTLNRTSLHDCAVFGDSAMYFWFDDRMETGQMMRGDIRAECLLNTNVVFGNPYSAEVQTQPFIILVRRRALEVVRREAAENGCPDWQEIQSETETDYLGEDDQQESRMVTELTRFWKVRGEDGRERVHFMTVCGDVITRGETETGLSLYPIAWWSWIDRKNSMHGVSPVTEAIPTQIAINQMMTFMHAATRNVAFPKLIYDQTKFPNGFNGDPSKPIAVRGDVNQAIYNMTAGMNLPNTIPNVTTMMREMMQDCMGASDAQLGNVRPDNTSAIIAAQKATSAPLELQKRKFEQFNEDCIRIIIDMMCAYYGQRQVVIEVSQMDPVTGEEIKVKQLQTIDFDRIELGQLDINVEVGAASYWSELMQTTTLDNLMAQGIIEDKELYLESIPAVNLTNKNEILRRVADSKKQQAMMAQQGAVASAAAPMTAM